MPTYRQVPELDNGNMFFGINVVKEITFCKFDLFAYYLAKIVYHLKNRLEFCSVVFEQPRSKVSWKQTECILGKAFVGVAMSNFWLTSPRKTLPFFSVKE
jgi:hypothetical protein